MNKTLISAVLIGLLCLIALTEIFSRDEDIVRSLPDSPSTSRAENNDRYGNLGRGSAIKMKNRTVDSTQYDYAKRPSSLTVIETLVGVRKNLNLRPLYRLVDDDGRLTSQATKDLNLTKEENAQVQKCYDQLQSAMLNLIKRNTQRLQDLEVGNVVEAYRMKPFPADGEASFGIFLDDIERVIGSERAWDLTKSIPIEGLAGQLGQKEILIRVIEPPSDILNSKEISDEALAELYVVQKETRDPISGNVISKSSSYIRNADRTLFNFLRNADM